MSDPMDWVALTALPGIGPATLQKMLQAGWSPAKLLAADEACWRELRFSAQARNYLAAYAQGRGPLVARQQQVADWLARYRDSHLLALDSEHYPSLLKAIPDPPPLLYLRGNPDNLHLPQIALVGSRKASRSGINNANAFADALSRAGLIVTSGMAHGIDGAAHQAAVNLGRPTVAVFGTGPDRIYPAAHRLLAARILDSGGCWVSELPPGTAPLAHNFPRRNRIISGLSAGVLVVEAAPRSGSLITARQALDQGREVFALPGSLSNPQAQGCHDLIREGAQLVTGVEQILEPLAPLLGSYAQPLNESIQSAPDGQSLTEQEMSVLDAMGFDAVSLDQLAGATGLSAAELNVVLISLELKGVIDTAGSDYRRL